jgi:dihydrofolate synthase/folylpolyglutamate synthase
VSQGSQPRSLGEWLDFIGRQASAEIVMGLERVRAVWQRMGSPRPPVNIVVGGTNGKGSTCAMLEAILRIGGYRTGFYSSPHLIDFNERIRVCGVNVRDAVLVDAFERVEAARRVAPVPEPLTYFEYATLAALEVFRAAAVEVGILEVGMGGRLDAVNVVDGDAAVLTSVDLDHQAYLGDTIEKIGYEKAHIARCDRPLIFADRAMPQSVEAVAMRVGARLLRYERDYRVRRLAHQWEFHGPQGARQALPYPALRGAYQLKNAAAALMALDALAGTLPLAQSHVKRGLLEVEWPGRMQVLPGRPVVVLDVAHNPHAARALDDALGGMPFFHHTYAVFGMLADKDMDGVIEALKPRFDHWFIAGLDASSPRGATLEAVAAALKRHGLEERCTKHVSMRSAFAAAKERAGPDDRIVAFGSFYAVAQLLDRAARA